MIGITALSIASKIEEILHPLMEDFIDISDNVYSEQQMIDMEQSIIQEMDCQLAFPIVTDFFAIYTKEIAKKLSKN